jgi:hypothetical protein
LRKIPVLKLSALQFLDWKNFFGIRRGPGGALGAMKKILSYALGSIVSFLPPRYRPQVDRSAGIVSGIVEIFVADLLLIFRAITWMQSKADVDFRTAAVVAGSSVFGSGIFVLVEFWLNPLHLLFFYFLIEGIVRTSAAFASHQVIGLGPLYIVSSLHDRIDKKRYERSLGPLVADEIIRGGHDYALKVYSCRPKLHWNPYMTVEFDGEFFQYFKEEHGALPRRFIYYLRRNPVGRAVVVVDCYRPDNVLKPEPDKWAGTPNLWHQICAIVREWRDRGFLTVLLETLISLRRKSRWRD